MRQQREGETKFGFSAVAADITFFLAGRSCGYGIAHGPFMGSFRILQNQSLSSRLRQNPL
ncbi:hypothetical protein M419DRAFT_120064 [Trichoderma reesei RUT C-30]|uniref:Uncharacterized protein n=1 Tax=Hypocrea jecorina (strain ATCC 56765 / BCRC 32924 / NRRL 11460 / Rut C-30) TaxID=1344414 RepID=A0A024S268_HYPJR|nr:hypothetical protein M419DRAFT_120064 [Trichoderma reesei RUT C-30]